MSVTRILRLIESSSNNQTAAYRYVFRADTVEEAISLVLQFEEGEEPIEDGPNVDGFAYFPEDFWGAGGFADELIDYRDEQGNDCRHELIGPIFTKDVFRPHLFKEYQTLFNKVEPYNRWS